jgi:hypothetical protein
LVTDLPADFETFGQAVATSMADLLGGTTGQILAKASNTDMDFSWITNDVGDITAVTAGTGISGGGTSGAVTITNSMATEIAAKGDLIVGTGSATFDNLTAGSNGETLVADSSTSTGLRYQGSQAAGKNAIINGGMDIWQRGTSISRSSYSETFLADRWYVNAGAAFVASRESSIVPTGFQYSQKITGNGSSTPDPFMTQIIETSNAILYAGQTVTMSAYIYATSTSPTINLLLSSSTTVDDTRAGWTGSSITPTRSGATTVGPTWTRISSTFIVPSSAKTLMAQVQVGSPMTSTNSFYFTGVQLEIGSVATSFQRAGATIQGELSACRRYLPAISGDNATSAVELLGYAYGTNAALYQYYFDVPARVRPTGVTVSGSWVGYALNANSSVTPTFSSSSVYGVQVLATSGLTITAGQGSRLASDSSGAKLLFTGCEL